MQVIPAVDVLEGRVVRLLRGDYDAVTDYGRDPVAAVRRWVDEGAGLVHVVDLDGARSGAGDAGLWRRLGEAGLPFQAGGGIRSAADAASVVGAGAERIVVGTAAVWERDVLQAIVDTVGPERVVAALDVRGDRAEGAGWRDEGRPLEQVVEGILDTGVRRLLVTAIARDGTMEGPDLGLLAEVRDLAPGAAIIASGGVGSLDHLRGLAAAGVAEAAIVGRALYEGAFSLAEAQAGARTAPPPPPSPG